MCKFLNIISKIDKYILFLFNTYIASLGIHYSPGVYKAKVSINVAGVKLSKNAKIVVKKRA